MRFNAKENDNEMKGVGNSLNFGARMHDSRTGKFFSIDPLDEKYPNESNYIFAGNSPILMVDIDGKFKIPIHQQILRDDFKKLDKKWFDSLTYGISTKAGILGALDDNHFDGRQGLEKVNSPLLSLNKFSDF